MNKFYVLYSVPAFGVILGKYTISAMWKIVTGIYTSPDSFVHMQILCRI